MKRSETLVAKQSETSDGIGKQSEESRLFIKTRIEGYCIKIQVSYWRLEVRD